MGVGALTLQVSSHWLSAGLQDDTSGGPLCGTLRCKQASERVQGATGDRARGPGRRLEL